MTQRQRPGTSSYAYLVSVALAGTLLAACGSGASGGNAVTPAPQVTVASTPPSGTAAPSTAANASLSGICPDPLVIQSSWFPEVQHFSEYTLIGPNGKIDAKKGSYSGEVAGITVEVRAGGPFVGYQPPTALMYQHSDIFIATSRTDDQYLSSGKTPTVAVLAPLQYTPLGLLWDPRHYNFTTPADVAGSGAKVLAALKNASADFLTAKGYVKESQWSFGWDGSPGRLVASDGKVALFDYADQDTYNFEHQIDQWGKPLDFKLIKDMGYNTYDSILVVKPETIQSHADCLKALIPMIQQADVDYLKNPGPINEAMTKFSDAIHGPTKLTEGLNNWVQKFDEEHGVISNGTDGTFGSFDVDRVTQFMSDLQPILQMENIKPKPGLTAPDLVTNEFLDPKIHM